MPAAVIQCFNAIQASLHGRRTGVIITPTKVSDTKLRHREAEDIFPFFEDDFDQLAGDPTTREIDIYSSVMDLEEAKTDEENLGVGQ